MSESRSSPPSESGPRVSYLVRDGVAEVTLQRPARKNALDLGMYDEISDALSRAGHDSAARCLLLYGGEDAFCAGNDIDVFLDESADILPPILRFMNTLHGLAKPVVAAVGGPAIGIGATMLLHCDLVYAAQDARFQFPFVGMGICPEFGSSLMLIQRCGYQRAAQLLLLCEPASASEMEEMGLVNGVLAGPDLLSHARAKAARLAAMPADAVQTVRDLMRRGAVEPLPDLFRYEMTQVVRMMRSEEASQLFRAFLARKRKAA
jgi:enoyl-CoA hydratase/carnithine racemase